MSLVPDMAAHFSSALQLTDLDDFLAPSQDCVKPVKLERNSRPAGVRIQLEEDGAGYFQVERDGSRRRLEKAKIALSDCLACSGCVTSAESVLVAQQSHAELLRVLDDNNRNGPDRTTTTKKLVVVASLSPQSRASLAAHYGLSSSGDAGRRLASFLRRLGVHYVFDAGLGGTLSLLESQREFVRRFREKDANAGPLPMLTSACPGWVCYAEKTQGGFVLPHVSSARSPQQMMGSLVKGRFAERRGLSPGGVYHVAVMPCHDKKLEASRPDFYLRGAETREVDCVVTSGEVLSLLREKETSLLDVEPTPLDEMFGVLVGEEEEGSPSPSHAGSGSGSCGEEEGALSHVGRSSGGVEEDQGLLSHAGSSSEGREDEGDFVSHAGSSSGGYLHHVFTHAAKQLFGVEVAAGGGGELAYKTTKNKDFREVTLEGEDGQVLLRFAAAYGFRNIQNVVLKLRRGGASPYHFVEVMACPAGCANGGGQVKAGRSGGSTAVAADLLVQEVERLYRAERPLVLPEEDARAAELYRSWLRDAGEEKARALLHTRYHAVEKTTAALNVKW